MRSVVVAACMLASFAVPAHAGKDFDCGVVGGVAEAIMAKRQSGTVSMSEMVKTVDETVMEPEFEETLATMKAMSRDMIIRAFEEPRWMTPEAIDIAIFDFKARFELACFKILAEQVAK